MTAAVPADSDNATMITILTDQRAAGRHRNYVKRCGEARIVAPTQEPWTSLAKVLKTAILADASESGTSQTRTACCR